MKISNNTTVLISTVSVMPRFTFKSSILWFANRFKHFQNSSFKKSVENTWLHCRYYNVRISTTERTTDKLIKRWESLQNCKTQSHRRTKAKIKTCVIG